MEIKYFIVDNKVVSERTHSISLAYKNYLYDNLADARNFLKEIKDTIYDNWNLNNPNHKIKEELHYRQEEKRFTDSIKKKEPYLYKYYNTNYSNSEEWFKREELEYLYTFYDLITALQDLKLKDLITNRLKSFGSYKVKHAYLFNILKKGDEVVLTRFLGKGKVSKFTLFSKEEAQKVALEHKNNLIEYNNLALQYQKEYMNFHEKSKLSIESDEKLKNIIIKELKDLKVIRKNIYKYSFFNRHLCHVNTKELYVKDLSYLEVKNNIINGYNLLDISNEEPLMIIYVGELNGRLILLNENGTLLRNFSKICIDTSEGFSQVDLEKLSFFNPDELT